MSFFKDLLSLFFYKIIYFIIFLYQKIISPLIPARCRYYPTCSNYGKQALQWHGVSAGGWLLLKRIGRCHPLGGHGIDFVPLPLPSYTYYYVANENMTDMPLPTSSSVKHRGVYRDEDSYVALLNHLMKSSTF